MKFRYFFKNYLKFYRIFGVNLEDNIDNLEINHLYGVRGGGEPRDASEVMEI